MNLIIILFWISIALVFYSYFGYAIVIWIYLKLKKTISKKIIPQDNQYFEPEVTLIVATYNEENVIEKKILNCLDLDYPVEKIKLIFVADGSSDNTVNIIKKYPQINLLYKDNREGKVAAINRAMQYVATDYVIFCDANTFLNKESIKEIVKHYADEKIGAVAGEKKILTDNKNLNAAGAGEGLYWKYESTLKKIDSDFYSVVGAAGELFSIRTKLYEYVDKNVLLDDFIISMKICMRGYKVVYEPKAYAQEAPSLTMRDEQKRKIRISAGGFQSILMLKSLLNIFKYGKLSFLYISHRVLRWMLCPLLLPVILLCNLYIVVDLPYSLLYTAILILQIMFYIFAVVGWIFYLRNKKINIFYVAYYFVFMNLSLYIGFKKFITNKQTVLWDKAKRVKN
jgi:cellulose synthase/poly-beta-1,6-N-acetylglucosamine synthase-like glycosyltransferase